MRKLILGIILLALATIIPIQAMAGVDVSVNIGTPLPPRIVFEEPPAVVVIPETDNVYVVPDIDVDLFFWNGWWWRPWGGRWYCSRYYDHGWVYYNYVPVFYYDVDPGWRGYYRHHDWYGHRWDYERIHHREFQQNWQRWQNNRHWERQRNWDVQDYQPRPQHQRQEQRHQGEWQYRQRPEVQQHLRESQHQQYQRRPEKRDYVGGGHE